MDQLTESTSVTENLVTDIEITSQTVQQNTKEIVGEVKGFVQTYKQELLIGSLIMGLYFFVLKK